MNIQQSCSTLCINIGFDHRDLSICHVALTTVRHLLNAVGRVLLFVRPFIFALSFEATRSFFDLHCMYIGHDHSSPGTGSQGYRSRLAYRLGQCKNVCARLHDNIWPTCVAYWKRGIFSQAFLATPKMPLRRHQLSPSAARLVVWRGRDQRQRRSSAHVVVVTRSV